MGQSTYRAHSQFTRRTRRPHKHLLTPQFTRRTRRPENHIHHLYFKSRDARDMTYVFRNRIPACMIVSNMPWNSIIIGHCFTSEVYRRYLAMGHFWDCQVSTVHDCPVGWRDNDNIKHFHVSKGRPQHVMRTTQCKGQQ
jgi:hypothetical protein